MAGERSILYIGNRLTKHGFNPTTIDLLSEKLGRRYSIQTTSSARNSLGRLLDMLTSVYRLRKQVDLVLIDTYSTLAFYYAFLSGALCKLLGLKYVPILHGGDLPARLVSSSKMCRMLFGRSYVNVSPSLFLKDIFEGQGYKVRHIPNFIEIDNYPFRMRSRTRPKLLFVRSFHKQYNPVLAVRILKATLESFQDSTLCMVGPDKDGSLHAVTSTAKELRLSDRLRITGGLSKKEWTALSVDYDFFINTTNYDNMPVSVIEAMALGMVVISTNVGGLPRIIKHGVNGILVEPDNQAQFASWIKRIVNNPALAESLSWGARRTAEQFDWSRIEPVWTELIDSARE